MNDARSTRPESTEFPSFYAAYVSRVPAIDVVAALRQSGDELLNALRPVPEERGAYQYAEGKWTIRTVIGHVIDTERIFSYRALRLARGDSTSLPGFDENTFAAVAESDCRTLAELLSELAAVRESTVRMFDSFPDAAWTRSGTVNNAHITVRALAHITAGHAIHHLGVLREKYGI